MLFVCMAMTGCEPSGSQGNRQSYKDYAHVYAGP